MNHLIGKPLRLFLFSLFATLPLLLAAQESYTDRLQKRESGKGVVVLHQDAEIEALVNGTAAVKRTTTPTKSATTANNQARKGTTDTRTTHPKDTTSTESHVQQVQTTATASTSHATGRHVRVNGFRVQIYLGGSSSESHLKAQSMERSANLFFPEQRTYTRFVSPHWICHVGDFKTRTEAQELLSRMRQTGEFPDAMIVPCKVNVYQ